MAAPPSNPPKDLRSDIAVETIEKERIEEMTRTFRGESAPQGPAGAPAERVRREYRARAVLSFHRFLGRWTAP